jgi:hypothetical protein
MVTPGEYRLRARTVFSSKNRESHSILANLTWAFQSLHAVFESENEAIPKTEIAVNR